MFEQLVWLLRASFKEVGLAQGEDMGRYPRFWLIEIVKVKGSRKDPHVAELFDNLLQH